MGKLAHPSTRWLMWDSGQGVLDEQFMQLQQLQDESSPNFVSEVISIYFRESEKLLKNLRSLLYVTVACLVPSPRYHMFRSMYFGFLSRCLLLALHCISYARLLLTGE